MSIKKVIHLADVHIRNFQRLEEYTNQLEILNDKINEEVKGLNYDEIRIVISGDICHSKITISNELISFICTWIRKLEKIGKVIVISGNHDLLVDNKNRVDTLSAIFTAAEFKNAIYLDKYFGYESGTLVDENITWALYSIFSDYRRPDIEQIKKNYPENTIVGLFHGPIVGSLLNNGTKMDSGISEDIFDGCKIVMAGDIHKRQEIKGKTYTIVYPGSLIQQNFGETVTQHGFASWDIENGTYKFVDLPTEYSLYRFEIESPEDIDNNKEILTNY